jgi:flagellar assembly protein FliH
MISLSKIVRASQITFENQKYVLSTEITFKHTRVNAKSDHDDDIDDGDLEVDERSDEEIADSIIEQAKVDAENILNDGQQYVDEMLQSAKADAESIISKAYDEAGQISERALKQGYDDGYANGQEEAHSQTADMIQQALAIKRDLQAKRETVFRESEHEIVMLVLDIAEKILQKRVEEDEALIYDLARVGIEKCLTSGIITLRVSETDFDGALGYKNAILVLTENVEDIVIKRDKALKPGSCVLDTQAGSVDSGVWTQFEQVRRSFESLLSERITEYDTESV